MTPATPRLDQTWVLSKDLKDQPESLYVLITGAARPVYYAVDSMESQDGIASFWRTGEYKPVYICRAQEGVWALLRRDTINLISERGLLEAAKQDQEAVLAFYAKLDPEEARAQAEGLRRPPEQFEGSDTRPMPGHYL